MYFFKILNWYKHGLINNEELNKLLLIERKNNKFNTKDFLSLRFLGAALIFMSALALIASNTEETRPFMEAILALPVLGFIFFAFVNLSDDYQEQQNALRTKASPPEENIQIQPNYYLTPKKYLNPQSLHDGKLGGSEVFEVNSVKKPNKDADSILGLILRLIIVIVPLPYMHIILYVGAFFPGVLIYQFLGLSEGQAGVLLLLLMVAGAGLYLYMFYRLFRIYFVKRT